MSSKLYRIIEHTADTGFEVKGSTKEKVFQAAALAFFQIMWSLDDNKASKTETIRITGIDLKELLVNFLEEFLYLYDAKSIICTHVEVTALSDDKLSAKAWLRRFDEKSDREILGIKAVTYHQLFIGPTDNGWKAQVFLDI